MGANNWRICPRCKWRADKEQEAAKKKADELYGRVSAKAYEGLLAKAQRGPDLGETLREDWSLGVGADGLFSVTYECHCTRCGFKHAFKREDRVPVEQEETRAD